MKRIVHRRVLPVYLTALIWTLYCLLLPLYKLWHFIVLIAVTAVAYELLSKLFPAKVELIREPDKPVTTGDEATDALLREGTEAVKSLRRLSEQMRAPQMSAKCARLAELTDKIFRDVVDDPADFKQVRRFADFFLPTTLKLMEQYVQLEQSGITGQNTSETMRRIEEVTDTTVAAYERQLDALFADQALDIETDIEVLRTMLKKEGLSEKDFSK